MSQHARALAFGRREARRALEEKNGGGGEVPAREVSASRALAEIGQDHYGRNVPELAGRWVGTAARAAGLAGEVDREVELEVIVGRRLPDGTDTHPNRRQPYESRRGGEVRSIEDNVALGLVFTLGKSASALQADERLAPDLDAATQSALAAVVSFIEAHAVVRRGKNGRGGLDHIRGLIGVANVHLVSSMGDPHLHVHLMCSTRAQPDVKGDDSWLAIWTTPFFQWLTPAAGGVFQRAFEHELTRRTGICFDEEGEVVLPGLTSTRRRGLIDLFSSARDRVEQRKLALQAASGLFGHALARTAWARHRRDLAGAIGAGSAAVDEEAFEAELDAELVRDGRAIRARWRERAATGGFDLARLIRRATGRRVEAAPRSAEQVAEIIVRRAENVTYRLHPGALLGWAMALTDEAAARAAVLRALKDPRLVVQRELRGDPADLNGGFWSSANRIVPLERFADSVERSEFGRDLPVGPARDAEVHTSTEELELARAVLESASPIAAVVGVAGARKTTLAAELAVAFRAAERVVWATSRNAKRALETGAAMGADSVHSPSTVRLQQLATRSLGPRPGDLLVVDEAVLCDSRAIDFLIQLARQGVVVRLLGDTRQLQSIDGLGATADLLEGMRASGNLAELTQSYRCAAYADEHCELRRGDPAAALRAHSEYRCHPGGRSEEALREKLFVLLDRYPGASVIAASNERAHDLASLVQEHRLAQMVTPSAERLFPLEGDPSEAFGELANAHPETLVAELRARHGVELMDLQRALVGDRVRTRHNRWSGAGAVLNGEEWLVIDVTKERELVLLRDDGELRTVRAEYARDHVELAYALVAGSAQGVTLKSLAIVVVEGFESATALYSMATRSTEAPIYLVPDCGTSEAARDVIAGVLLRDDEVGPAWRELGYGDLDGARRALDRRQDAAARPGATVEPSLEVSSGEALAAFLACLDPGQPITLIDNRPVSVGEERVAGARNVIRLSGAVEQSLPEPADTPTPGVWDALDQSADLARPAITPTRPEDGPDLGCIR